MSRIVVDLPDRDLRLLDALKDVQKKPRAEIIRIAVSSYLESNGACETENAFGLWRLENGDGLAFQSALREEWSR